MFYINCWTLLMRQLNW